MSIDDIRRPTPFSVDHWRAVLHEAVDQVLDEILDAAESEWSDRFDGDPGGDLFDDGDGDDVPPGDPPSACDRAVLHTALGRTGMSLRGPFRAPTPPPADPDRSEAGGDGHLPPARP